jgi:hypothetical protein
LARALRQNQAKRHGVVHELKQKEEEIVVL